MERTKKVVVEPEIVSVPVEEVVSTKLRWRKVGGGSLRVNIGGVKRIIKPGEVFSADLEELPKSSMDLLVCLDSADLQKVVKSEKAREPFVPVVYTLKKVKGTDLWNLIDSEGKALNEKPLSKVSAEELLNGVNA